MHARGLGASPKSSKKQLGRGAQATREPMKRSTPCPGPMSGAVSPSRRDFLWRFGGGLGGMALASLIGGEQLLAADGVVSRSGGFHHPAKAKRVIQLFMNGGMSPQDTFDYKPRLIELHGKPFDPGNGQRVESV